MRLDGVKSGDVVKVDKKGRQFYAIVDFPERDGLAISPIGRETWRAATAREIVGHYRKMGRR